MGMDRAHLTTELSADNLTGVGVGVYQSTTHIGLLCRDATGTRIKFFHLAFHEDLRTEDDVSKCYLWVEAKVEEEQANIVAAQARLIYGKNHMGGIPYGFSPYGGYFGAKGEIHWSAAGNGLTCATFVLAVFDRSGIQLVNGETWPVGRADDIKFQREMVERVRAESGATASHIKGMKADIGQVRFRVMEVAGAVAADQYPVDFATADALCAQLAAMVEPAQPDEPPAS